MPPKSRAKGSQAVMSCGISDELTFGWNAIGDRCPFPVAKSFVRSEGAWDTAGLEDAGAVHEVEVKMGRRRVSRVANIGNVVTARHLLIFLHANRSRSRMSDKRVYVGPFNVAALRARPFDLELGACIVSTGTAHLRPLEQGVERRAKRLAPGREAILHLRRHLVVDGSAHNSVGFQLAELLRQHLLRNRRNRTLQVGEAQNLATEQMKQDQQLPPAFDEFERLLDAVRRGERSVFTPLTRR